jgi:branched-chain amino acid transport system ATP-binding protein
LEKILLKTVNLTKDFGGIKAVDEVNIEVYKGELLGIIGPNGAGKTTLLNLITGILKPTKGKIIFNEREIQGMSPSAIARMGIARTFQIVRPFKRLSVFENVLIACGYRDYQGFSFIKKWKNDIYIKKAESLIRKLGLEDYMYTPAENLPLGYLKRLEIARALALDPKLLLLDEVTSGLSKGESEEIKYIVKELKKQGISIIFVEHNVPLTAELSDRIYVLNFGRVIAEGRPEEVIRDKKVIEAYLGEEYAT